MRRLEFTCEGCDLVEEIVLPSGGGLADVAFNGWIAHRAVVYEGGSEAYEISADLCPKCVDKMRHAINPANWPRIKAAAKDHARKIMA